MVLSSFSYSNSKSRIESDGCKNVEILEVNVSTVWILEKVGPTRAASSTDNPDSKGEDGGPTKSYFRTWSPPNRHGLMGGLYGNFARPLNDGCSLRSDCWSRLMCTFHRLS